jgi:hypothetical protein
MLTLMTLNLLRVEKTFDVYFQEWKVFVYFSYASDNLSVRAELTEDFLATSHGVAVELESSLSSAST